MYSRLYIHSAETRLKIKLTKMLNKPSFVIYYRSNIKLKHRNNCKASVSFSLCQCPSENPRFTVKRKLRGIGRQERQIQIKSCIKQWTERERRWSEISWKRKKRAEGKGMSKSPFNLFYIVHCGRQISERKVSTKYHMTIINPHTSTHPLLNSSFSF